MTAGHAFSAREPALQQAEDKTKAMSSKTQIIQYFSLCDETPLPSPSQFISRDKYPRHRSRPLLGVSLSSGDHSRLPHCVNAARFIRAKSSPWSATLAAPGKIQQSRSEPLAEWRKRMNSPLHAREMRPRPGPPGQAQRGGPLRSSVDPSRFQVDAMDARAYRKRPASLDAGCRETRKVRDVRSEVGS